MRFVLLLLLLLINFTLLKAQGPENMEEPTLPSPILKFSPFSLIDPLSSIQLAMEHQIGRSHSLQHEVGYITNIMNGQSSLKERKGLRLRNEYRYYLLPDKSGLGGLYLAPEILFIYFNYYQSGLYGRGCTNSWNCQYIQKMEIKKSKQVWAITPKIGYQYVVDRFVLDIYAGIGYRNVRVREYNAPGNKQNRGFDFFNINKEAGIYELANISMGMKFGFLLKKNPPENLPYYREY